MNVPNNLIPLLEDACLFTLPLMMMHATATATTNTLRPTENRAPANQFCHARKLADASFKNVVTPNVDTIYSQMILDLSQDDVIITLPKTDRFCTLQLLDAYTNCAAILDASSFVHEQETFFFTKSGSGQPVPEGMIPVPLPTSMGWIIIRTICFDKADEENVHRIQSRMKACTRKQHLAGTADAPPAGTFDEGKNIIPSQYVLQLSLEEYFTLANELMVQNPPAPEDAPELEKLSAIHVGPGLSFDPEVFGEDAPALWQALRANLMNLTTQRSLPFFTKNGNWLYLGKPIAEFGTEYAYRAFIALFGLGANPVSVAVYPKTDTDAAGSRLTGQNKYLLRFEKGALPPVTGHGFWSVTAYDSKDNFLIDNELNRYCINNRSDVVWGEDGALEIAIQAEKPAEGLANWLPVTAGEFHLVLRIYLPDETVITNQWPTPILSVKK